MTRYRWIDSGPALILTHAASVFFDGAGTASVAIAGGTST
jgi:hypothetical protein